MSQQSSYQPVSCDFHDHLEARASLRQQVHIRFWDGEGVEQRRDAVITDVYAQAGADYLTLSTGETLRLDQLIEAGGVRLADF